MKIMSKIMVGILALVVASMGLIGCATSSGQSTVTPEKVQRSVDVIVGTFVVGRLQSHPDSKPAFVKAKNSLNVLVANETWDIGAFGEVIAATGLSEGAGENMALYISTGVTLLSNFVEVDLSKVEYAKAVIVGGATALNRTVK